MTPPPLIFELRAVDYDQLELRWTRAFGVLGSPVYQALLACVQEVDGVDKVEVLRYTALIKVAEHVPSLGAVGKAIVEAVRGAATLQVVLEQEAAISEYSVAVLPDFLVRSKSS